MNLKSLYLSLLFICISSPIFTQNLVSNPSFEEAEDCELAEITSDDNLSSAIGWYSPTGGTSNHYHPCHTTEFQNFTPPTNFLGSQTPLTGSAYAGILCMQDTSDFGGSYREYLQTELLEPLEEGKSYEVGFYCVLAENSVIANNKLGAYFSTGPLTNEFSTDFGVEPQMEGLDIISDTANWTLISGIFVAEGGETHLTIGNHRNYQNTDYDFVAAPNFFSDSYYYIDDVYVTEVIADNIHNISNLEFEVFPNPAENVIQISNNTLKIERIDILNVYGTCVYSNEAQVDQIDVSDLPRGHYIISIQNKTGLYRKQLLLN